MTSQRRPEGASRAFASPPQPPANTRLYYNDYAVRIKRVIEPKLFEAETRKMLVLEWGYESVLLKQQTLKGRYVWRAHERPGELRLGPRLGFVEPFGIGRLTPSQCIIDAPRPFRAVYCKSNHLRR